MVKITFFRYTILLSNFILGTLMAWSGNSYSVLSQLQKDVARELLEGYEFQGYERVLDVGCGDGAITAEIAQKLPDGLAVGLDQSDAMIDYCRERYDLDLFASLAFEQGDVAALGVKEQYDVCVSTCALHWVDDQVGALSRIREGLVPGGTFMAIIPARGNPMSLAMGSVMERPDNLFTRDEYLEMMESAGFSGSRVKHITRRSPSPSREALGDWIAQWLDTDEETIAAVVDAYCEQNPGFVQGEGVVLSIDFLQVEAMR